MQMRRIGNGIRYLFKVYGLHVVLFVSYLVQKFSVSAPVDTDILCDALLEKYMQRDLYCK